MFDPIKKSALNKKAYEVAYAIFRVAGTLNERSIAEVFKNEAIKMLEGIVGDDYQGTEKSFSVLDYAIKLSTDIGAIGFANGEVLNKEMIGLRLLIAESMQAQNEELDIASFFSKDAQDASQDVSSQNFFSREGIAVSRAEEYQVDPHFKTQNKPSENAAQDSRADSSFSTLSEGEQSGNHSGGNFLKSGMRQIAILDKIRQSGSCRMRDIQEILPDSSERTIRYDLESLIERKIIERTGNGGPSVSYRMRQI